MQELNLDLRLVADPGAVTLLLDRLEAFAEAADLPARAGYRLAMICEELAANVVSHGAAATPSATFFTVGVRRRGDELDLRLEDDGPPFNPLTLAPPDTDSPMEMREVGGLGIHIVRSMARTVSYERIDDRNRLDLVLSAQD